MFRLSNALLSAALALPLLSISGQTSTPPPAQPSFEVKGKIVDATNTPLPGASISLRAKGSTVTIAGAIAGKDGAFRVIGLRPGIFSIRVVSIGYSPVIQDITIKAETPVLDLGTAKLAPIATTLGEISVKEERATMTAQPDRNAYTAKSIAPGAANASEILENVPAVTVDVDGKVSLRGNENVVIQINGRPTPMRGTQLAAYLKTLSANVIDRIEVVPNPSAKYDPEGMAGIINIALKTNVDLGLSGALNTAVSTADRYNNSLNVGYQSGPLTTFSSIGIVADERTAVGLNDRSRYDASSALLSTSAQDIRLSPTNKGQNLNLTVDYKLSTRDVLSNALLVNHRSSGEASRITHTLLDGSGNTVDQFIRPRGVDAKSFMFDYDIALKRTYTPRTHELSLEFRYNRAHDEDSNEERRLATGGYVDGRIDRNDAVTKQLTGQLDYVRNLRANTKLETGWKSTKRLIDRDFSVTTDESGNGTWSPSPLSNVLAFDEAVHAAYAVVSQTVKKWDLQAGVRAEYADRNFSLATQKYPYNYTSFFPSGVAAFNVSQATQLKASYSRRIRRPGLQELNPFPTYFDADNVLFGNPELNPEYTDAYELGLTRSGSKGMVQLTPFYRHTTGIIRVDINTTDTLEGREITSITFQNLAKSNSWGSDLTGQLKITPKITAVPSVSAFTLVTDGGSASVVGSSGFTWTAKVNLTAELSRSLTFSAAWNYRAPMKLERGEIGVQQSMSIAMRKKIQGDKGTLLVRVADPFEMLKFHVKTGDASLMQITERNPHSRFLFIGYQYNYGRPPRVRQVAPDQTGGGSSGFGGG